MATKKTSTATKKAPSARSKSKVGVEDIRQRAEQIYNSRVNNGQSGDALSDWLQAEKELSGLN